MVGDRLHVGDLPAAGQAAVGVAPPVDALDDRRAGGRSRTGRARCRRRPRRRRSRRRAQRASRSRPRRSGRAGGRARCGSSVDPSRPAGRRASAPEPSPPSIGRGEEAGGRERRCSAARANLRSGQPADEPCTAREVRRAPAVEPRESRCRRRCDGRERRGREGEREERRDDGRSERVRRHGEKRDGVELQPRDRRGRNAAGGRDRDHARERPRQRIALEHPHEPRHERRRSPGPRQTTAGSPGRTGCTGSSRAERARPAEAHTSGPARAPTARRATRAPRQRPHGSPRAGDRPRARMQPSRPTPRARPGAGAGRRATQARAPRRRRTRRSARRPQAGGRGPKRGSGGVTRPECPDRRRGRRLRARPVCRRRRPTATDEASLERRRSATPAEPAPLSYGPPAVHAQHHVDAVAPQPGSLVEPVRRGARQRKHAECLEFGALRRRAAEWELEQDGFVRPQAAEAGHEAGRTQAEASPPRRAGDDDGRPLRPPHLGQQHTAIEGVEPGAAPPPARESERERDEAESPLRRGRTRRGKPDQGRRKRDERRPDGVRERDPDAERRRAGGDAGSGHGAPSRSHQPAQLVDARRPDAGNRVELVDRRERPVLRAVVEDLLGGDRTDSRQRVELFGRCRGEMHRPGGRRGDAGPAGPGPPRKGTTTCSPSARGAARFTCARSARRVAPPARATASAMREPFERRRSPGRRTAPTTSTTRSSGAR